MKTGERTASKTSSDSLEMLKKCAWGLIIGLISMAALTSVCAVVMTYQDMGGLFMTIASIIILVLSGFITGFSTAKLRKKAGMLVGGLSSAMLFAVYALLHLAFTGPVFSLTAVIKLALCVIPGCIGGIMGVNQKRKKVKRK